MTDRQVIFRQARRSLMVLALACVFGLALFGATRWLSDQARDQAAQAQEAASTAQAALTEKQTDLGQLEADINRFSLLRQQGLVGVPDRAVWVEQLAASRVRVGLPDTMTYTLQPPKALTLQDGAAAAPGAPAEPGQALFHDLELGFVGVHEEELLAFFKDYQSQVKGRWRVNACNLSSRTEQGLSARCTLRFFTLPDSAPAGPASAPQ